MSFRPLKTIIKEQLSEHALGDAGRVRDAGSLWPGIAVQFVPGYVVQQTRVMSLRQGVLTVRVLDAGSAQILIFARNNLLAAYTQAMGPLVQDIRFLL